MLFPASILRLFCLPSWAALILALALPTLNEWTFWQLYKWQIAGVALLCGLQTFLIAVLLFERSQRRRTGLSLAKKNIVTSSRRKQSSSAASGRTRR